METIYRKANAESVKQAAELLNAGEILALPTETVYGIAADATNNNAVQKIFTAKGRPQDNPLIVHVLGLNHLNGIVSEIPESAQLLAAAFWPGPLTMVLPKGQKVASLCTAGLDTVAVRAPSHPVARAILHESACVFAAPSANLSGSPSPTCAQDVLSDMDGRLSLIIDGGNCDVGVESTVVSLIGTKPILLRPGIVTMEQIELVLGVEVELSAAIMSSLPEGENAQSPGMKYKHYSPKACITMIESNFEQFKAYVEDKKDKNIACLCFDEEQNEISLPCVTYGKKYDGADQAQKLFRALRALDEQDEEIVYARAPQKDGVSMAVYNRLVRAAAFRVVTL